MATKITREFEITWDVGLVPRTPNERPVAYDTIDEALAAAKQLLEANAYAYGTVEIRRRESETEAAIL